MVQTAETADTRVGRMVDEIAAKGDFPAAARMIERLQDVVRRENCPVLDVARIILADPGLSSKVLRVVNSSYYRRRGEPISTVTRAIILLGFEPLRDLATGLLLIDQVARSAGSREQIREALCRTLLCGLVARALSFHVGYPHPEEAYLLGLFANWGILSLAAYHPAAFERACALGRERDLPLEDAVAEVFGFAPAALASAILERWDFPQRYIEFFRRRRLRDKAPPTAATAKLAAVVDLAAEYTWHAADGLPADDPTVPYRYEALFGRSAEEFQGAVAVAVEALREQAPLFHLGSVAWMTREHAARAAEPAGPACERQLAESPEDPAGASAIPEGELRAALAIIAEITRAILAHEDINDTLAMVLEGIARTGRFELAFLALLNARKDRLVGRLGYGEGVREFLSELSVPLVPEAGVLAETVRARHPQIVSDGCGARLVPAGTLAPAIPATSLVSYPLVVRGKAVGVLVAARSSGRPVGPADCALAELFCNQAALALDRAAG